ncbi:hypothetical protein FHS01_004137 [Longimicrobium terrae]|uniref:Uncharacterized protein n=1 Tax=Longimicrobium terrae TaxID=1639882 RepID=A0A841H370_9BACT|nr:hypothetical protein [Longimicrobium terrae]MBB6072450.1 hypothetical protein [Longimicrobium terrae]
MASPDRTEIYSRAADGGIQLAASTTAGTFTMTTFISPRTTRAGGCCGGTRN